MANEVDNRVVQMTFDNRSFEKNVATSMTTIEKLKESLNFDGVGKGLEEVEESARKVDFSSVGAAVETVQAKFSAMQVVAMTAISNITTSVINLGKKIVSAIVSPISTGGWNRAMNIENAKFQLEGLGVAWEDIEEDINWGVKATAYGLDSAAKAAAQLVASQVELGTEMKAALRGISGVASMTNSEYDDIARIFTTVAGNGRLMGDQLLQISSRGLNAASTIANYFNDIVNGQMDATESVVSKVQSITGGLEVTEADIRTFVSKGLIDFEVFATAMDSSFGQHAKDANNTFTGALSNIKAALARIGQGFATPFIQNMVKVFNSIIPLIDNIKKHLQPVFEVVGEKMAHISERIVGTFEKANQKVTDMFSGERVAGLVGRTIDVIERLYDVAKRFVIPIKEAFSNVFVVDTSFSKWFDDLLRSIRLMLNDTESVDSAIDRVTRSFSGFFAVLDIAKQLLSALYENVIEPVIESLFGFGDGVLSATASIGDWLTALASSLRENDTFNKIIGGTVNWFKELKETITDSKLFQDIVEWMGDFTTNLKELFETIKNSELVTTFKEKLGSLISKAKEKFETPGFNGLKTILDKLTPVLEYIHSAFVKVKDAIGNGIKWIWDTISRFNIGTAIGKIWSALKYAFENIGTVIGKFVKQLSDAIGGKSGLENILKTIGRVGVAMAGFAGGRLGLSLSKFFNTFTGANGDIDILKSIAPGFNGAILKIKNSILVLTNTIKNTIKITASVRIFKSIAAGVLELAGALWIVASIDEGKLNNALFSVTALFGELIGSVKVLNSFGGIAFSGTSQLVALAGAVLILAESMAVIGKLSVDQITASFIAITGLITELIIFTLVINTIEEPVTKGAGVLIGLAAAIRILAGAMKAIAGLNWEEIAKGLVSIGALMLELAGFMGIVSTIDTSSMASTGFALIEIAAAVAILAKVVKTLGNLDYETLIKGLVGLGVVLLELAGFLVLVKKASPDNMISIGTGLILLGIAMKQFASAVESFGDLSWEQLAKGLLGFATSLAAVTVALNFLPKNTISLGAGLTVVAIAIKLLTSSFMSLASLKFSELVIGILGLAGCLTTLAVALAAMNNSKSGAVALTIASAAMLVFVPAFRGLASLSWSQVAKGLIALAGAFTVIGVATKVLAPMTAQMLALAKGLLAVGAAIVVLGAGITLIGIGLTSIAVAVTSLVGSFVASCSLILLSIKGLILGLIGMIPAIINALKEVALSILRTVIEIAPTLGEAVKTVVLTLVDVLVTCIPTIADGVLQMVLGVLEAAKTYIPQIVDVVFDLVVGIIDSLANKIPELVKSVLNLVGVLFNEIANGITMMNPDEFRDILINVGIIAALIVALSEILPFVPGAIAGVLAVGVIAAELSVVLAAVGELSEYVGGINSAGDVLEAIGNALGKFVGGIAGGVAEGFMDSLPAIGQDLSDFMVNASGFIEGARGIDESVATGMQALASSILILTASEIMDGIATFITRGQKMSFSEFGAEISEFGVYFAEYAEKVKNIDPRVVEASSSAAESLANFARKIPNEGGWISKIVGENKLSTFAEELVPFGESFRLYYASISAVKPEVVEASAAAAETLAAFADKLPNQGGALAFFVGDNKLSDFAAGLELFGDAFRNYYADIRYVKPEVVRASSAAATTLATFAEKLPNQGGVISFFVGDNKLTDFAEGLEEFGNAFRKYYAAISTVKPEVVEASSAAAESIAAFANNIPDTGGLKALVDGDNDLKKFGKQLSQFGPLFKEFSDSINGISPMRVEMAANAGKSIAEFAGALPETGGIESWFEGGTMSLSKFGKELADFGPYLAEFSKSILMVSPSKIMAVMPACDMINEFAKNLPETNDVFESWFGGGTMSLSAFGAEIAAFGPYLKEYSKSVVGYSPYIVEASIASATLISDFAKTLPDNTSVLELWVGGATMSLSKFGEELASFGPHLKDYSKSIIGFSPSLVERSMVAASAVSEFAKTLPESTSVVSLWVGGTNVSLSLFGKELADFGPYLAEFSKSIILVSPSKIESVMPACEMIGEFANSLPKNDGLIPWIAGEANLAEFGNQLAEFGPNLKSYSDSVDGVDVELVNKSAIAAKALAEFATELAPNSDLITKIFGSKVLTNFGEDIVGFAESFVKYSEVVETANYTNLTRAKMEFRAIVNIAKDINNIPSGKMLSFAMDFQNLAYSGIDDFISVFTDTVTKENIATAVDGFLGTFIQDMLDSSSNLSDEFIAVLDNLLTNLGLKKQEFSDKGKALGNEFLLGLIAFKDDVADEFGAIGDYILQVAALKTDDFYTQGQAYADKLRLGLVSKTAATMQSFSTLMKTMIGDSSVSTYYSKFKEFGQKVGDGIVAGLNSGSSSTSMNSALGDMVALVRTRYTDMYNAGYYLVKGFYDGTYDYKWLARQAGITIGNAAIDGARYVLEWNSPSKVFYEGGEDSVLGYYLGVLENVKMAEKAGIDLAESSESGFNKAMSRIAWAVDTDIDFNPVITPVLDLTEIQNGVDSMNYMLGQGNYAIDGAVDLAASAQQGFNAQLDENNEITMAILDLKRTMEAMQVPSTVYNNTFNITGDDPDAIADEVSSIFQHDIERGDAVWA